MDAKEIGKKLKQLRIEKGLKQSEVAKALNVSDKLISKWETGISVPSTEFTLEICEFFGIEVGEFLNSTSPTKSDNAPKKELSKGKKLAIKISAIVLGAYIFLSLVFFLDRRHPSRQQDLLCSLLLSQSIVCCNIVFL